MQAKNSCVSQQQLDTKRKALPKRKNSIISMLEGNAAVAQQVVDAHNKKKGGK